jgi:hypothetical protein
MTGARLKYVNAFRNKARNDGRVRYYFRRRGMRFPLPGLPGSDEFVAAYGAALVETAHPIIPSALPGGIVRSRGRKNPNASVQPTLIGVDLLMLKGKIVYVGESLNMPKRVAEHRSNGRPFEILFMFWAGWDRDREEEIKAGDPMPERPQLVYWAAALEGTGNGRRSIMYRPILILSHHVLSRTAQRHGLRTVDDMLDTIEALNQWVLRFTDNKIKQVPPEGWRIPVNSRSWNAEETDAQLIVQRHRTLDIPIAVTILDKTQVRLEPHHVRTGASNSAN